MRWLAVAHDLPDRTRLRTLVVREDKTAPERIADALASIHGVREVKVRPFTGSILIEHDVAVTTKMLVDMTVRVLGIDRILSATEPEPLEPDVSPYSSIARKLVLALRDLDRDVRRRSEGTVDMGIVMTTAFAFAGLYQIATSDELPLPPWFNLAWWGFRTFVMLEQPEINAEDEEPHPTIH